jgi:hypothetical protein
MILYHRAPDAVAKAILQAGFRDGTGTYMTTREWTGTWLSNIPLDINEGAVGGVLLRVELTLDEAAIAEFEWIEEGKPYREWLVPASLINTYSTVRVIDEDKDKDKELAEIRRHLRSPEAQSALQALQARMLDDE